MYSFWYSLYKRVVAANSTEGRHQKLKQRRAAATLFQRQFDFAPDFGGRNLVPVLRSWCQNCYYTKWGETGKGRKEERFLGVSRSISCQFSGNPENLFSSARYSSLFPKTLCQTSDLFFAITLSDTIGAAKIPMRRRKMQTKVIYFPRAGCWSEAKRCCYGFSDYHHLETDLLPPHSCRHTDFF